MLLSFICICILSCSSSKKIQKYIDKGIAKGVIDTTTKTITKTDTLFLKDTSGIDIVLDSIDNIIFNSPCDTSQRKSYIKKTRPSIKRIIIKDRELYCSIDTTLNVIDKEKGVSGKLRIQITDGKVIIDQNFKFKKFEVNYPKEGNLKIHAIYLSIIFFILFLLYILYKHFPD